MHNTVFPRQNHVLALMFNFGLNLFLLFFPMKRPVVRMNDVQMTAACVALDRIDQANLT